MFSLFIVSGCAHHPVGHVRGTVAAKLSDTEAEVCFGKEEVAPGDKVSLYKNECKRKQPKVGKRDGYSAVIDCKKVKIGDGEVLEIIDEHYSTIKVNGGVNFSEGTIVEKD